MDLKAIADNALARLERSTEAALKFMSSKGRRYAIGRNEDALNVHRLWKLDGIVDDFNAGEKNWNGIPIVRTNDVACDAWVINCATSISPVAVLHHLERSGLSNVVGLHEVAAASNGILQWPNFVQRQRQEVYEHPDSWLSIYESLHDEISRKTFLDVLRYRLTADPFYMQDYTVRIKDQYFEDFMNYRNEVFVDGGGFDGDTAQAFAWRYPDYRKILVFEPSEKNMRAARERLAGCRDIEFKAIGLSDRAEVLPFNQHTGSSSAITSSGDSKIYVDKLDAVVDEPVSLIKMDLEGWELKALHGSSEHLARDRPKLAIAVYHDAPDFRLVHEFVNSFGHDYLCFIRHYTQGWSETIMFFRPR